MDGTILVADDDRTIRTVLTQALTRAGCKVHATSSLSTLMRWVGEGKGDLVISDVIMPDGNGIEMLPKIAEERPGLPVIVISANNTITTAVKASDADAYDYLPKPFDLRELMKKTSRALEETRNVHRSAGVADGGAEGEEGVEVPIDESDSFPLVGRSPVMQALYRLLARLMNADIPVLIVGESGTGKTLIARAMHDLSDRRDRPFVSITAADLRAPDGAQKALAKARDGTLVIEDIGNLDLETQALALPLVDAQGEGVPRLVATNQTDLSKALKAGEMRQDLCYRLSGATVSVPPVRDRLDDVPTLCAHFLTREERGGEAPKKLSKSAEKLFQTFSWPGNVRQLEHVMRQLRLVSRGDEISREDAEEVLRNQPLAEISKGVGDSEDLSNGVALHLQRLFDMHGAKLPPPGLHKRIMRDVERPLIEIALGATGGNQHRCAQLLGINRNTLRKKVTELDINVVRRRTLS